MTSRAKAAEQESGGGGGWQDLAHAVPAWCVARPAGVGGCLEHQAGWEEHRQGGGSVSGFILL